MIYTRLNSNLPMMHYTCYKVISRGWAGGLTKWARIEEIETDGAGNVIRLQVMTITVPDNDPEMKRIKQTPKDYTSRVWITRIMREYAHIAARRLTPALV